MTAVLLVIGIVGSLLLAIIGATSSGFPGFLIGGSLPVLITAIIGLAKKRRTWLNVSRVGMVVCAAVSAFVLLVGALTTPAQIAASSASHVAAEATPSKTSTPSRSATPTHTSNPTPTPAGEPSTAANPASDQKALNVLATLQVKAQSASAPYDRVVDFGTAWLDMDHNGCDTRNDILARDLHPAVKDGSCTVISGTLADPYTGTTISFTRGVETSRAVQIDHVVPLGDAWVTGASLLTLQQRETLANDPLNLLAVDGSTNESKSDKDASEWLPPQSSYDCTYVARQVAVKAAYHLWVTQAEHDKMKSVLAACPTATMPVSSFASGPVVTAPVPQTAAPKPAAPAAPAPAAPAPAAPAPAPAAPQPAPAPAPIVVHPGAFCSPVGAIGVTSAGTPMVCGTTANSPTRARWHAAG